MILDIEPWFSRISSQRDNEQKNAEDVLFDMFRNDATDTLPVGKFLAVSEHIVFIYAIHTNIKQSKEKMYEQLHVTNAITYILNNTFSHIDKMMLATNVQFTLGGKCFCGHSAILRPLRTRCGVRKKPKIQVIEPTAMAVDQLQSELKTLGVKCFEM